MSDFQATRMVRSRKPRTCPECRTTIGAGQSYRREAGHYDGSFYAAIMCEPCAVFADRYVASMQCAGFLNADEVSFSFGAIIDEAAEYIDYKRQCGQGLPARRDAILALFDDFDEAEREYRRREIAQRKEAALRAAEHTAEIVRRLNYGQSSIAPSALPATPIRGG